MALVLHSHPQFGGTMNNPLVYDLFHMFHGLGCTAVRFNFRGVGRSQGTFDSGAGELSDAAAVLDWMNTLYPNPSFVWVCGISFGAWIGMQLLMRRPEITGFVSIAPPASMYDFAFLAPCPASGLIVHGTKDLVVPENIRLLPLPAYSPELNPQEHLWDEIREKEFPNRVFDSLDGVKKQLRSGLVRLARDGARVRSITAWPWIVTLILKAN